MTAAGEAPGLTVVGYAMWTAAGHDGPSSVAAMRAGVSGAARADLWDFTSGGLLNACRVQAHQWWEGASFLPALIAPVIEDCRAALRSLPGAPAPETVPVLLSLAPPDRPARAPDLDRVVMDGLAERLGGALPKGSGAVCAGRCGLPPLLGRVRDLGAPFAILVGAESFLRQVIVDHYNRAGRLLSGATSSGFVPGEAAAALVVARGRQPGLVLTGMGAGQEPGSSGAAPVTGAGLTQAMRAALDAADTDFFDITVLMGDLNGEHARFKEHAIAAMRLDRVPPEGHSRRPRETLEHWNVAESVGEAGAALMPAAMGWAFQAGRWGCLPGRVIFTGSEDDRRRVAVTGEWQDG